ncbi:MAG TPA: 50S ribosomal protein L19 [Chitinophagales bacterium]|nr:50S ribosomal protein L19 [Chitinophagales bacterium]
MTPKVKAVQAALFSANKHPEFGPGDNITVSYKITEGNKERIQEFRGDVIQVRGAGTAKMFTVRKISNGVGVERIFPVYSPYVDAITVNKVGRVRRAKLFYQRNRSGKASRIQEKRMIETPTETTNAAE